MFNLDVPSLVSRHFSKLHLLMFSVLSASSQSGRCFDWIRSPQTEDEGSCEESYSAAQLSVRVHADKQTRLFRFVLSCFQMKCPHLHPH